MIKKPITYTNPFTDQAVTENFYFHLSAADLMELEVSQHGGLKEKLELIRDSENNKEILDAFRQIVAKAYGKRSDDGTRFIKTPELTAEFTSSEAYSALLLDFMSDPAGAADFINGLPSKSLDVDLDKVRAAQGKQIGTGAMGKPRTPAEAAALQAERSSEELGQPEQPLAHPSDPAATMAEGAEEFAVEDEAIAENVFDKDNPKILTQAELDEMDGEELKRGLADGRYKLQ